MVWEQKNVYQEMKPLGRVVAKGGSGFHSAVIIAVGS